MKFQWTEKYGEIMVNYIDGIGLILLGVFNILFGAYIYKKRNKFPYIGQPVGILIASGFIAIIIAIVTMLIDIL